MRRHAIAPVAVVLGALLSQTPAGLAQQRPPARELAVKYVRDSEEYATLARQVYRLAGDAVARTTAGNAGRPWAVALDVDETALDNSTYQIERAAYDQPYDTQSWGAWVERRQAAAVPGAIEFIALVRKAGGRVAWISNRDVKLTEASRANLNALGLWDDRDRLCTQKTPQHTKAERRREVVTGQGDCSWGSPTRIAVFVGDQMGDFPGPAEQIPQAGSDTDFGRTCFLLPNPMYGGWTTTVTRK